MKTLSLGIPDTFPNVKNIHVYLCLKNASGLQFRAVGVQWVGCSILYESLVDSEEDEVYIFPVHWL